MTTSEPRGGSDAPSLFEAYQRWKARSAAAEGASVPVALESTDSSPLDDVESRALRKSRRFLRELRELPTTPAVSQELLVVLAFGEYLRCRGTADMLTWARRIARGKT